jgi:hypothetical protein
MYYSGGSDKFDRTGSEVKYNFLPPTNNQVD